MPGSEPCGALHVRTLLCWHTAEHCVRGGRLPCRTSLCQARPERPADVMLRAVAAGRSRLPSALAASSRGFALAPASTLLRRTPAVAAPDRRPEQQQRELSSKVALSKMGSLSVDPLAANTNVQGVEYVLTGFDKLVNWARKSSMWPMTFGLA